MEGCVSALYQSIGIGGLRPNTVFLNFPRMGDSDDHHKEQRIFADQLGCGAQNENCMVVVKGITDFPRPNDRLRGHMDIWWIVQDGGILMLIAYLLHQHKVWKGCKLRIYVIAQAEEQNEEMKHRLQRHIYMLRIDATVFIVNMIDPEGVEDDAVQKTLNRKFFDGKCKFNPVAFLRCSSTRSNALENRKKADEIKDRVQQDMAQARLRGFGKALLYTESQMEGCVSALYQSIGIGGLRPNTVFLNFPRMGDSDDHHKEQRIFADQLGCGAQNENCMVVVKGITDFPRPNDRLRGHMDIWLKNLSGLSNGGLANGGFTPDERFLSGRNSPASGNTLAVPNSQSRLATKDTVIETSFIQKAFQEEDNNDTISSNDQISIRDIDDTKVQKMNAAVQMNQVILEYSTDSQLVLLSLPKPPKSIQALVENYLSYVKVPKCSKFLSTKIRPRLKP
uniref:SLC12 domain-containing protein n=1 Tax=Globodera pallida TaxID=36090 RepID=A0A183BX78_GLOPA